MNTTNQSKIAPQKVLITGASGLLGVAAIERFLDAGWDVVGVSRRKPELPSGRDVDFLSVDLRDREKARAAFEPLTDVTHVAYTALHEKPELVAGWSSKDQIDTNNAMLRNVVEPIVRSATNFQHISVLQGTKVYGVHLHPIPIPARERDARKDHPNFFFDQEAYVGEMGAKHGFSYTALRPQLVTGPTPGALNVLPAIGAYAAIRREKGEPFGFPGGPSFVWEAADADLVGDVAVWAAQSPQAANEAFNITNGDVFEWRNVWPGIAETLGVEAGPDTPMSVTAYLAEHADVWGKIVAKYGLRSRSLRDLVGQGDQHADFAFAYGAPAGPRAFVSTVKLRQAGFVTVVDTEVSFRKALQSLIDNKLLAPASKQAAARLSVAS
ncbi:SDR family oxidoreductase [Bradyrhizobium sp. 6(2017)]|uniref:SDR family oxidoreductase n=1 Tax=Bradyrhizobium sp. 6(2017) TaxID=1197460 RepID=UPI0013E19AA3|nr:SDR family oxidoreductase [Bradyrhizobium sp. 6(2017)]QIG91468.1 SDR family oxidoreductase [Bradyrhizobium sp. 6(2017)]